MDTNFPATITCDDCEGVYPMSEKEKGDYFLPGSSKDMVTTWVCKWCSANIAMYRQAEAMVFIHEEMHEREEHKKTCKGDTCPECNNPDNGDDYNGNPTLPFKPKLVK